MGLPAWRDRVEEGERAIQEAGGTLVGVWVTLGRYDVVEVFEAPDDEIALEIVDEAPALRRRPHRDAARVHPRGGRGDHPQALIRAKCFAHFARGEVVVLRRARAVVAAPSPRAWIAACTNAPTAAFAPALDRPTSDKVETAARRTAPGGRRLGTPQALAGGRPHAGGDGAATTGRATRTSSPSVDIRDDGGSRRRALCGAQHHVPRLKRATASLGGSFFGDFVQPLADLAPCRRRGRRGAAAARGSRVRRRARRAASCGSGSRPHSSSRPASVIRPRSTRPATAESAATPRIRAMSGREHGPSRRRSRASPARAGEVALRRPLEEARARVRGLARGAERPAAGDVLEHDAAAALAVALARRGRARPRRARDSSSAASASSCTGSGAEATTSSASSVRASWSSGLPANQAERRFHATVLSSRS